MSHFTFTVVFAFLIAVSGAVLDRRTARERAYRAVFLFISSMIFVVASGWGMYLLHG